MVVQHNMMALNANRSLNTTTKKLGKSTEKLSSGYKINRSADDAAGLSISEKMRSQIRGLNRASANAQDGVSLIQTAEGALNEAHSILQRMNELAVQAGNDTNTSADRNAIKKELDQLAAEVDKISTTTQFNSMNLLDGSFKNKNLQVGASANQNIELNIYAMDCHALGLDLPIGKESQLAAIDNCLKLPTSIENIEKGDETYNAYGVSVHKEGQAGVKSTYNPDTCLIVSDYRQAGRTMTIVQNAIEIVSEMRSSLGATQNRLEHTIANLDTTAENTQASESRIRDTDMADEMVQYSATSIIEQAGQSMLSQANSSMQSILSLLQG